MPVATASALSCLAVSTAILVGVTYRDAIHNYVNQLYQVATPVKDQTVDPTTLGVSDDPGFKTVSESSVSVMYRITQDMTDEYGRLFAGEMLKIIDIVAGVASRRHSEMSCVTISLDRFILVQEIKAGDTIHVYGSVNRAWGSSLETGIKVTREDPITGKSQYCCHAYLTFVALAPSPKPNSGPSPSIRLGGQKSAPRLPRPKLKRIIPVTLIEKKRFLLAGRRRELRINNPKPSNGLEAAREEVLKLEGFIGSETELEPAEGNDDQQKEIASLERDLLVDAYNSNDPSLIKFDGPDGRTFVTIDSAIHDGLEVPVIALDELQEILASRKRGRRATWHELVASTAPASPPSPTQDMTKRSSSIWLSRRNQLESPTFTLSPLQESTMSHFEEILPARHSVTLESTFACTMHIVMPQHANSNGVLFGGQLMEWMENAALISAHRVKRHVAWTTAGMDGLEFREAAAIGDVLTFRAVVTKAWRSSIEVYVCAHADIKGSPTPKSTPRFTNECFLTLVALLPTTSAPIALSTAVEVAEGSAMEKVAEGADARKAERLDMKSMLVRVYAGQ